MDSPASGWCEVEHLVGPTATGLSGMLQRHHAPEQGSSLSGDTGQYRNWVHTQTQGSSPARTWYLEMYKAGDMQ